MFAEFYFFLTITTETRQVASWLSSPPPSHSAHCVFFSADVALMTLEFLRSRTVLRFAEVNLWEWMF